MSENGNGLRCYFIFLVTLPDGFTFEGMQKLKIGLMKSLWLSFVFWMGTAATLQGQTKQADSLLQIVAQSKSEVARFNALLKLGVMAEKTDTRLAVSYYYQAIGFPFHMEYSKAYADAYNSLGTLLHTLGQYDSSRDFHHRAFQIARTFGEQTEMVIACQGIAENFMRQSQHDSARLYLQQALPITLSMRDRKLEAGIYNSLGNLFLEELNYDEALNQFINAAKIYDEIKINAGLSKALINIGNIECILAHYDKALDYTQRGLRISIETNNEFSIAYCHGLVGRIYRSQKKYDNALEEYREAMKYYIRLGNKRKEGEILQNIGNLYYDLEQYHEALREYEKSLQIGRTISNPAQMAYAYSGIGFTWYRLKNFDKAIDYFNLSVVKAREIKNGYLMLDAYEILSNIYAEQNRHKEALKFCKLSASVKDSLTDEDNRQGTEELEAKYQNAKKQSEIDLLQKDQQLKSVLLKQSRTVQTFMVVALVLVVMIGLLAINRNRLIHQSKQQMEIEQMRNQIARDLHDDMGSTLSSIHIISQLAMKQSLPEITTKYFQRIGEHTSKMMESMADMVWSINPNNDSLQKIMAKMKEFSAEILEPKNMSYQFNGDEMLSEVILDVAKRKNLFLIFKEAINNAAKYSEGTMVCINVSKESNDLVLRINDNGKGFDLQKPSNGNGLRNMKERAREIKATMDVETALGQGTTLTLKMALT